MYMLSGVRMYVAVDQSLCARQAHCLSISITKEGKGRYTAALNT